MNLIDLIPPMKGYLEIIVKNSYTGEILRHDKDHNQVQDWARHSIAYLLAGRIFCTLGNHGEEVTGVIPYTIPHYDDGQTTITTETPWKYSGAFSGLIQNRSLSGDEVGNTAPINTPLYPFFPTKMRFGVGGLDNNQLPIGAIPTSQNQPNTTDELPYVLIDREYDVHIKMSDNNNIGYISNVTFSCTLPGGDVDYPYNSRVISEAGLFCDAAIDEDNRTGLMLAYRNFYGITKTESIEIKFNWRLSC